MGPHHRGYRRRDPLRRSYAHHQCGLLPVAARSRMDVAKRRGAKRAKVALARKIAVILHRMWVAAVIAVQNLATLTSDQITQDFVQAETAKFFERITAEHSTPGPGH